MNQEKLALEKLDQNIENLNEKTEDFPEANLDELRGNSEKEDSLIGGINKRLEKSNPDFQEKVEKSGFLRSLGEKIKNSKLLRTGILAFSLSNASPALASELGEILNNSDANISDSVEAGTNISDLSEKLKSFNISIDHQKELEEVYEKAPEEARRIIMDELENGHGVSDENFNEGEDSGLLITQQQVIDLQNSGEMAPRREGGIILPFDERHSGKTDSIEYSDDRIAEDGGKQRLTMENASENQIRSWVNYLKKNSK